MTSVSNNVEAVDLAQLFGVDGSVALVTGGTDGIGAMIAEGFVRAGARTYINGRDPARAKRAARRLSRLGNCTPLPADLLQREGRVTLADAFAEREPRLHILVNNAATIHGAPLDDYAPEQASRVLELNVAAVLDLTRLLHGRLRAGASRRAPARVINIGSADGIRPPHWETFAYSASKAGVHMLTRHLARHLAPEHITVNAIAPGPFPTQKLRPVLAQGRAPIVDLVPLGRLGTASDIVGAALFLASQAGAYVTGAVLPLDGGMTA